MYVNDKQSDKRGGGVGKRVGEVDLSHFPPKYFAYFIGFVVAQKVMLTFYLSNALSYASPSCHN